MTVTVVLPAYNEETRIVDTLSAVKGLNLVDEIIVVNDGSTDRTAERVREIGVTLIDLPTNLGKGGAMNATLPYINCDIVVFLDADLGSSANEAGKIIQVVRDGLCDLAIAAFPPPTRKGGFGLVKGTAAWAIRRAGKMEATAPLSGQRAMTRRALEMLSPFDEDYGVELGMTIKALALGLRVMEVPTIMSHKETGRDIKGFLHRGKQFLDVIRVLNKLRRSGL
ncbi:MAG: glycosyltransferase family 2 protein [Syntrophomonadaceae bacterium]|nr:glycosyltransferase family 2 protein [Syntrophomonadaceae bacterium]MDD3897492.1 glycosyltransferase family 2 protein [Syntrophomonadaceae bacterium]MDD4561819.1 glycosyltransferase family 2 protein [Syntrophomonadaceae bacterium]